jgi:hypothetical protein
MWKQRDIMSLAHKFLRQERNDPLRAAIKPGGYAFLQGCNLANSGANYLR